MTEADKNTPLTGADALFLDLDGVVYKGRVAVPKAVDAIQLAATTIPVGYITNNASRTPEAVALLLQGFGLTVTAEQVITSPQAAAKLLGTLVPSASRVFVVGGAAIDEQLHQAGFITTRDASEDIAAVVQGFHPDVNWQNLADAAYLVQEGAVWVATNTDWTIPLERGIAPGNGTLVGAVHTAAGSLATVAGKPEAPIFEAAKARFNSVNALMVGDRLDTDIMGAVRAGIKSAIVLTGIDGPKQILAQGPDQQPDYILDDLSELHQPYPARIRTEISGMPYVTVREATVRLRDNNWVEVVECGANRTDLLRAACALIWPTGRAIFGFYVPEEIFDYR